MKDLVIFGSKLESTTTNLGADGPIQPCLRDQMKPKANRTTETLLAGLFALVALTNFVACAPGRGGAPAPQLAVSDGPGGTGGGNVMLGTSKLSEVEAVVDREFENLLAPFTGMAYAVRPFLRFDSACSGEPLECDFTPAPTDFARLTETSDQLKRLNQIMRELTIGATPSRSNPDDFASAPRVASLQSKLQLEKRKDVPCEDSHRHHYDGSAHGTTICVSLDRLTRIPSSSLKAEIQALLVHELMHVLGYGESDAQLMQRYFIFENRTGSVQKVAEVVNQYGYEIGYSKMLIENPKLVDPNEPMHGYFQWTRNAHLHFYEPILKLVSGRENINWELRVEAKRDRMQRIAAELVALAPSGADTENKKFATFKTLETEWLDAQKLALELVPIDFAQAQPTKK